MKKRRELDALVNGKLGGRKKKKGQHELLRDTESSDVEEFAIPPKTLVRNRRGAAARFCSTCMGVCAFFMLTACFIAVGGLVWVHIELKKDVDHLHMQLQKVQVGSDTFPEEIQTMRKKEQEMQDLINDLQSGPQGLKEHNVKIKDILAQLKQLNSTTLQLSKSLAQAPQLEQLPQQMLDVQKGVANFGSSINTLTSDVKDLMDNKDAVSKKLEELEGKINMVMDQSEGSRESHTPAPDSAGIQHVSQELSRLSQDITAVNATLFQKLTDLLQGSNNMKGDLAGLKNESQVLETRISLLELHPGGDMPDNMQQLINEAVTQAMSQTTSSIDSVFIDTVREQIHNMSLSIDNLSTQVQQNGVSSSSPIFMQLNSSVSSLLVRVSSIESELATHQEVLSHIDQLQLPSSPSSVQEESQAASHTSPAPPPPANTQPQESSITFPPLTEDLPGSNSNERSPNDQNMNKDDSDNFNDQTNNGESKVQDDSFEPSTQEKDGYTEDNQNNNGPRENTEYDIPGSSENQRNTEDNKNDNNFVAGQENNNRNTEYSQNDNPFEDDIVDNVHNGNNWNANANPNGEFDKNTESPPGDRFITSKHGIDDADTQPDEDNLLSDDDQTGNDGGNGIWESNGSFGDQDDNPNNQGSNENLNNRDSDNGFGQGF